MLECPFCHEKEIDNLPTFHYPGIPRSNHIECQTCGREFSKQDAEKEAETTKAVVRALSWEQTTDDHNTKNSQ